MGGCAEKMRHWGARNIVLLPHGCCQVRFADGIKKLANNSPEFDVIFIGSNTNTRNPFSHHYYSCRKRRHFVEVLVKRYGPRFGLYGHQWDGLSSWQGPAPFRDQLDVLQRGRVVFGGYAFSREDFYASDRPFIQIAGGVPFVDLYVPRLEKILRQDDHVYFIRDSHEMTDRIDRLLEMGNNERLERSINAARYILDRHTQYHRMKFLVHTAATYRAAVQDGRCAPKPEFDFFLPEINPESEHPYALCNWEGQ